MNARKLTEEEWDAITPWLVAEEQKLPKPGSRIPCYNATNWDLDDIYNSAHHDSLHSRTAVSAMLECKATTGKWPKVTSEEKFWLRARWEAGLMVVQTVECALERSLERKLSITMPDLLPLAKVVVLDYWDSGMAHEWFSANLSDNIFREQYDDDEEGTNQRHFERWIRRLENGEFIPKSK